MEVIVTQYKTLFRHLRKGTKETRKKIYLSENNRCLD
jgi:hypothetical protein